MEEHNKMFRHEEPKEDSISQLPDSLIHVILSRLGMRDVVKTTVLSRRWNNLWASTQHLLFDEYKHPYFAEVIPNFERFVSTVLLVRDVIDIHTFHLWWLHYFDKNYGQHHFTMWTQYAVQHNVKVLHIGVQMERDVDDRWLELPSCVFTCKSLEELYLHFTPPVVHLNPPEFTRLGRLRKVFLFYVNVYGNSLKTLISGSPVLEFLQMCDCQLEDLDICSSTLRRLDITNCEIFGEMIRISAPGIHFLNFIWNDIERLQVSLQNLSSLDDAAIQIDDYSGYRSYGTTIVAEPLKFVGLCNKSIVDGELSGEFGRQIFPKLKTLELIGRTVEENFQAVARFMESSPNLEKLELVKSTLPRGSFYCTMSFDCPNIKTVIHFQCGKENERVMELVEDFFKDKCYCSEEEDWYDEEDEDDEYTESEEENLERNDDGGDAIDNNAVVA